MKSHERMLCTSERGHQLLCHSSPCYALPNPPAFIYNPNEAGTFAQESILHEISIAWPSDVMNGVKQHAVVVHSGTKCRSSCSFVCKISHIVPPLCNFESIQSINSSACRKREYEMDLTLTLVMFLIVKCSCVAGQFKVVKSDPLCLIFPENVSGTTSLRTDTVPQLTLH